MTAMDDFLAAALKHAPKPPSSRGITAKQVRGMYAEMLERRSNPLTDEEKRKAFYESVNRLPPRILDNVGITINVADLPSWELYAYCRDRLYGTGRWSRFWFRRVRPWLAPERQEKIELAYVDAQYIHKHEFMKAILERGDK